MQLNHFGSIQPPPAPTPLAMPARRVWKAGVLKKAQRAPTQPVGLERREMVRELDMRNTSLNNRLFEAPVEAAVVAATEKDD